MQAVVARYPREGWKRACCEMMSKQAHGTPGSRAGFYTRYLAGNLFISRAPFLTGRRASAWLPSRHSQFRRPELLIFQVRVFAANDTQFPSCQALDIGFTWNPTGPVFHCD